MSSLVLISLSCGDILVSKEGDFLFDVNFVDLSFGDAKISFFNFSKGESQDWNPMWHNHIYYEMHFSFSATVDYKFLDRDLTLNAGEMLIIPPSVEHESIIAPYQSRDFLVISLDIEKLQTNDGNYESFVSALKENALKPIKIPENIKESLLVLDFEDNYKTLLGNCRLKSAAAQVVNSLFKKIMPEKPIKNEEKHQKILIDLMMFSSGVTINQIAEATNYSKRQISRIIKAQYGMTFSEIRRKIQKGKKKGK